MFIPNLTDKLTNLIKKNASGEPSLRRFFEYEIKTWLTSPKRLDMISGCNYYAGAHDILKRKRTAVGEGGELVTIDNLPNNRLVNNVYAKMVDQKVNYLLGKPATYASDDTAYAEAINALFNYGFARELKNIAQDALNCGVGWLYPFYDEDGNFAFKRFAPYEVLPIWKDAAETDLEYAIRVYDVACFDGSGEKIIKKVEIYGSDGIKRYELDGGCLVPDVQFGDSDYITFNDETGGKGYNWEKIPLIAFKSSAEAAPLIRKVKSLQDALNNVMSDWANNMAEDIRSTVLVVKNYDGEDLGEFRRNLATYGAVKVAEDGDLNALRIEVNADNYKAIISELKKAIVENAMGFDAKDDRLSGNPNRMNIQSVYSDIDLDSRAMETEFQAAMSSLEEFVKCHLANTGKGSFEGSELNITFNRSAIISNSELIGDLIKSEGLLSKRTLLANHPLVTDVDAELDAVEKEQEEQQKLYDPYKTADVNDEEKTSGKR